MTTSPSDSGTAPVDLAIVGAGPAGLAAAVTAAALGRTVTLLDAGARPGGQYYRHPDPALGATRPQALHHDWAAFAGREAELRAHERAGRVRYLANHQVWSVTGSGTDWRVHSRTDDEAGEPVRARAVLLATGAYERQLPFPGWTLPGVVGAGGAQAMLKSGLVLPGRRVVVAGSGPLLLAVAASLAAAGARVPAVVEAAGYGPYARHTGTLLRNPAKLAEGALYGAALLRHQVRPLLRHAVVEAHGTDRVEAVTVARLDRDWRPVPGTGRRIPCDALAVGHGLVPELSLATALGCTTRTAADGTAALVLTPGLRTSVPGVWAAGETGGVGGAQLALTEGEIAAHSIAGQAVPTPLARRRERLRAFADAMGAAHRPGAGWTGWLREETAVCRCEEVPAGRVREAVEELGATDARTVKLLTRAGMGWCQGRMCGPAVAALAGGEPAADRRPLACPVRLGELAELPAD
ncbi:FAD-dependent oxidoreductase [Streptomyces sp. R302]|uniref:FAD/NAD(P)-dependent oxidoreductase n=1 Tax=unclassified Streptomyces TaxID=2593676 RepID=UPI00145D13A1|nr:MULTISPECIES: FAD-dependent oxidoreductase [unclassified Streptomyces]NML54581.1 FAD-dependent oxidoreductase [Streptomyces sp. R301]NML82622.1 FAD-dependent oxidoreductase [Streptomyces sp. R302]